MLVLSRKQDQEILIGDQIKITILKTRGNTVRLGIEAPRDVKVIRGELTPEPDPCSESDDDAAEFTIVFGADVESEEEKPGGLQSVRFTAEAEETDAQQLDRATGNLLPIETAAETVCFQGRLPRVLKHNRLKEIVDRIAVEKAVVQVAE